MNTDQNLSGGLQKNTQKKTRTNTMRYVEFVIYFRHNPEDFTVFFSLFCDPIIAESGRRKKPGRTKKLQALLEFSTENPAAPEILTGVGVVIHPDRFSVQSPCNGYYSSAWTGCPHLPCHSARIFSRSSGERCLNLPCQPCS